MIKHFVLFKWRDEYDHDAKKKIYEEMKSAFCALTGEIHVLRKLEVHYNINPAEQYDVILIAYVESKDELQQYASHPAHVACVHKYVKPYLDHRAAIDIWIS